MHYKLGIKLVVINRDKRLKVSLNCEHEVLGKTEV